MNHHPNSLTLTLLLTAEEQQPATDEEYAPYVVLERYFEDWADERKADLYALIAEQYDRKASLGKRQELLSRLLWDNENAWAGR